MSSCEKLRALKTGHALTPKSFDGADHLESERCAAGFSRQKYFLTSVRTWSNVSDRQEIMKD